MEIGLYINGKLYYSSSNFEECAATAIDYLRTEWLKHKDDVSASPASSIRYLQSVREITDIKGYLSQTTYDGNELVIKPNEEKKYIVSYLTEFEEGADTTNEDSISTEYKYICNADKVRKVYARLRDCLELDIQARGFKSFDEMLGDEIECLQDTDEVYEVYDKVKREFHCVTITQLK